MYPQGNSQTERSPFILNAAFLSTNFENIFTWESREETSSGTLYYVQYKKYGDKWKEKSECQNITRRFCNLTRETGNFSQQFYARVRAFIPNCCTSEWAMSSRFTPQKHTIIGSPMVKSVPSVQSIKFFIQPPYTPLRDEDNQTLTVADIFSQLGNVVQYEIMMFSQKTKQKWVKIVSSEEFEITDLDAGTEYNGTIHIKTAHKTSKPYVFRLRTLPDRTWMPYLFVVILFVIMVIFGAIYYLINKNIKRYTSEQPTALDFKGVSHFQPLVPKVEHFLIPYNLSKLAQDVPEMQITPQVSHHLLGTLEEHHKLFGLTETAYQEQAKLPSSRSITQPAVPADHLPGGYAPQIVKPNPPDTTDANPSTLTYGLCIQGTSCINKMNSPPKQAMEPDSCVENTANSGPYKAQKPEEVKSGWWMNKAEQETENAEQLHQENDQDTMTSQNRATQPNQDTNDTLLEESVGEGTGSYRKQPVELLPSSLEISQDTILEADPLLPFRTQPLLLQGTHPNVCQDHRTGQWVGWDSLAWTASQWQPFGCQMTDCANPASQGLETKPDSLGRAIPNAMDSAQNSRPFTDLFRDLGLKIQWDHEADENAALYS
ncbi:interleukin-22 receptor subunit alpha-1 isoform X2 [Sceloporus undulatus]|uniref:interleukin-22 receptor subunit alpha-1 isoform X2 n=1 Tax=Sceloporus undulatus TaxID=8520 RepID=UPI001C4C7978|nr:interleukin-22 receptor subunit alpha-1 isoform X2 [Sceloporus undulatus]